MTVYGNPMVLIICGINKRTSLATLYLVSCPQLSFTLSPPDAVLGVGGYTHTHGSAFVGQTRWGDVCAR